jgi:adenine phosphoribosyltransferase
MTLQEKLSAAIRDVPDFPKPGILFKDISPIMLDAQLSNEIVENLYQAYRDQNIEAVAGIESRGFLFGYPLAMRLGIPFILIRKQGKLPYKKTSHTYDLEYGSAVIEIHDDAVLPGQRVLIHDDLLATGGSADAAAALIKKCGGEVAGFNFLVGLSFLNGEEKLISHTENISSLITF